jgi:hypothetical protein
MSAANELHFFNTHYERGLEWYEAQFAGAGAAKAVGEATPSYMADGLAVKRMAAVLPEPKLVVILRNPVDRAYSHCWLKHTVGLESRSFADAVKEEMSDPDHGRYLGHGHYSIQVRRLQVELPQASLYVMLTEQLEAEPGVSYAALCRFLAVDDTYLPPNLGQKANSYVQFRSLAWRRTTDRLRGRGGRALAAPNLRPGKYPDLDPGLRRELNAFYAADNADLAAYLQLDFATWWG